MKRPKAKLFTAEFINAMVMLLSMVVGAVTLITYQDRLPMWVILIIGFWYPVGFVVIEGYKYFCRRSDGL